MADQTKTNNSGQQKFSYASALSSNSKSSKSPSKTASAPAKIHSVKTNSPTNIIPAKPTEQSRADADQISHPASTNNNITTNTPNSTNKEENKNDSNSSNDKSHEKLVSTPTKVSVQTPEKKPTPSSWAALAASSSPKTVSSPSKQTGAPIKKPTVVRVEQYDEKLLEELKAAELGLIDIEEAMKDFQLNPSTDIFLQVRGLTNPKNKCFMNVVLQVLICSRPFQSLLSCLSRSKLSDALEVTPKMVKFYKEFTVINRKSTKNHTSLFGTPLTPSYLYPILNLFNPNYLDMHIYQEDAQEFMSFLLDKMHEELLQVLKKSSVAEVPLTSSNDDEWVEVGKGNKTSVMLTREDTFLDSPISQIFGGKLKSSVRKKDAQASSTIQPFYCLHLDIDSPLVYTLEDALKLLTAPETLEGYQDSKTKMELQASKKTEIEKLPQVLTFHLKRFAFEFGTQKVDTFISYPEYLTIHPSQVSSTVHPQSRKYRLFGVVSHIGKKATDGHYVCDIRVGDKEWLHFDDSSVYSTKFQDVLNKVAYLLLYERV